MVPKTSDPLLKAPGDADPAPAERLSVGARGGAGGDEAVRAVRYPRLRRLQRGDVARRAGQQEARPPVRHAAAHAVQEGLPGERRTAIKTSLSIGQAII